LPRPLPIAELARLGGVSGGHAGLGLVGSPGSGDDGWIGEAAGIGEAGGIGEAAGMGVGSSVTPSHYQQFMKYFSTVVAEDSQRALPRWDFLTNHAHVLVSVARDPGIRLREIAANVGITERAAHRILSELVDQGYVVRERQGRRNHYQVKTELPLRHPLAREHAVGDLLEVLIGSPPGDSAASTGRGRS
jgi:DNA-binding transcriptional ArsR family regulator